MNRLRFALVGGLALACSLWLALAPVSLAARAGEVGRPYVPSAGWPASIASTGDSITRAYNTGTIAFTDAPANSWSTGTNASVSSHYSRILAAFPGISGHNYNFAVTGAEMLDLNSQMVNVNAQHVDYVTVLMGANDACTPTEAEMTTVDTYRARFQTALDTLAAGSPDARVLVLSVPNVYNLWSILHNNSSARNTWALFGICQSLLANPQSTAQPDVDRRNRVNQRVVDYNTQLAQVCATNIHCRFDGNAVYNTLFVASDVSTRDYFHPTVAGQAKVGMTSYAASFDFSDAVAPVSWALSASYPPTSVVLAASDNVQVAGIEYRVDGGPILRYAGAQIPMVPGRVVNYRAVDVNGNNGAWNTFARSLSEPVPVNGALQK